MLGAVGTLPPVTEEMDRSIRIAWAAEGFQSVQVFAPRRSESELGDFARGVADAALLNRSSAGLLVALRRAYDGTFDLREDVVDAHDRRVIVTLHPPRGNPNPDD